MDNKNQNLNMPALQAGKDDETNPQGYPLYPVSEDICNQCKEEVNTNPEDASVLTEPNEPSEDEENNQYRLGGDMLNNPEEDHGE